MNGDEFKTVLSTFEKAYLSVIGVLMAVVIVGNGWLIWFIFFSG